MKNFSNRKGFTLVELLIVIVVIGVLSAMMMLSSTEAVSSAKANNIVANLRNLKIAVTAWYIDNENRITITRDKDGKTTYCAVDGVPDALNTVKTKAKVGNKYVEKKGNMRSEILKYMNDGSGVDNNYQIVTRGRSNVYVVYKLGQNNKGIDAKLVEKLKGKAKTSGLVKPSADESLTYKDTDFDGTYNNVDNNSGNYVGMFVMSL